MKEKINQLEILLNEIIEAIQLHLEIVQIDINEFDTNIFEAQKISPRPLEYYKEFRDYIIAEKNNQLFHESYIPKLKSLLSDMLSQLTITNLSESRFRSNPRKPYKEFIRLLEQGILNTESRIFGKFGNKEYSGHLTKDGYFLVNNIPIQFSSLRSAACLLLNKGISENWKVWYTYDENGIAQTLEYFRKKIN